MSVYIVVLSDPSEKITTLEKVKERLSEENIYDYSDNIFFISIKEFRYINELAQSIGFSANEKVTGFVMKMASIQGWDSPNLWEWIGKDE